MVQLIELTYYNNEEEKFFVEIHKIAGIKGRNKYTEIWEDFDPEGHTLWVKETKREIMDKIRMAQTEQADLQDSLRNVLDIWVQINGNI